jgi:hypothetical protein
MYNFVIFGHHWDLYKTSYSDVLGLENVRYISTPNDFRSPLLKLLQRVHWSPKLNKIINLPFKNIWNSSYYKFDFPNTNPICFVLFYSWSIYEKEGLIEFLRKKYPLAKMVCFFQDLVVLQKNLDINHIKNVFDLVLSFDQAESHKYGLDYHQLVYSHFPVEKSPLINECDVYFLGKAKNRLDDIIKTFEYLKRQNLKCDFYLVGVEPSKQVYPDEIHYIENMSYLENLQHVVSSRCLLEIMQQGGHGYTQRMCEAIAYDKKILTNNVEVKNASFYKEKYISVYSDATDIDVSFLNDRLNDSVDYGFKEQLSPKKLLSFIEKKLNLK